MPDPGQHLARVMPQIPKSGRVRDHETEISRNCGQTASAPGRVGGPGPSATVSWFLGAGHLRVGKTVHGFTRQAEAYSPRVTGGGSQAADLARSDSMTACRMLLRALIPKPVHIWLRRWPCSPSPPGYAIDCGGDLLTATRPTRSAWRAQRVPDARVRQPDRSA